MGTRAGIAITISLTDVDETPGRGTMDTARSITRTAARYFQFTLTKEPVVTITLPLASDAALYVSKNTPNNGWFPVHGPGYEHRRDHGKPVRDVSKPVTLTLEAGETYTVSIEPQ